MNSEKKSQVAVIALWVLVILGLLALGLAHRVSLGLRLNRFQRDSLKAHYLAKAGITKAVALLLKDNNTTVDSFQDLWSSGKYADGRDILQEVKFEPDSNESFTVGYFYKEGDFRCLEDEDRKLNINKMDSEQLKRLFTIRVKDNLLNESEIAKLADIIVAWRTPSEASDTPSIYKKEDFTVLEELLTVFEYYFRDVKRLPDFQEKARQLYTAVEDILTVYGDDKVNLNTALPDVLEVILRTVNVTAATESDITGVKNALVGFQENNCYFEDISNVVDRLRQDNCGGFSLNELQGQLINATINKFKSNSQYFRIQGIGRVGDISKRITAVVKRDNGSIRLLYWHQN